MVYSYGKAFRSLGHETYTVVLRKNPFYPSSEYDLVLVDHLKRFDAGSGLWCPLNLLRAWVACLAVFLRAALTCDIFIFVGTTSLLPKHLDYPLLKILRRKIVVIFVGSDVFSSFAYEQEIHVMSLEHEFKPYLDIRRSDAPVAELLSKVQEVRMAERYADLILSHPEAAQLFTRPYMRQYLPIDLKQYQFHLPKNKVPLVVHCPTARLLKGTKYVVDAVDQLRLEQLAFEFRLVEHVPHDQLRDILGETDVVVDQLFTRAFGTLTLEAMASGCAVLTNYHAPFAHIPPDCPAVKVSVTTLTDKLRRVLLDPDMRRQLGCAGRKYVSRYHDHLRVAQQILDWLEPHGIEEYDFVPTFFEKLLVLQPELARQLGESSMAQGIRGLMHVSRMLVGWPVYVGSLRTLMRLFSRMGSPKPRRVRQDEI